MKSNKIVTDANNSQEGEDLRIQQLEQQLNEFRKEEEEMTSEDALSRNRKLES